MHARTRPKADGLDRIAPRNNTTQVCIGTPSFRPCSALQVICDRKSQLSGARDAPVRWVRATFAR